MTHLEPNVQDNARYTINEASELLQVHRNTLRMHTLQGLIKCGFRKTNKRRFYTGSELKKYWRATL